MNDNLVNKSRRRKDPAPSGHDAALQNQYGFNNVNFMTPYNQPYNHYGFDPNSIRAPMHHPMGFSNGPYGAHENVPFCNSAPVHHPQ